MGGKMAGMEAEDIIILSLSLIGIVSSKITTFPVSKSTLCTEILRLIGLSRSFSAMMFYRFVGSTALCFQNGSIT